MSIRRSTPRFIGFVSFLFTVTGAICAPTPAPTQNEPSIIAIREGASGKSTVVVHAPKGTRRVVLQVLNGKTWATRAVAHLNGSGGNVSFQVPRAIKKNALKVTGSPTDTLPANFFKGKANFAAAGSAAPATSSAGTVASASNLTPSAGSVAVSTVASTTTTQPVVTEADIWKISGNTLFFFNQYRGLQVIDITNPDTPKMLGKLTLPAVGQEMYVIDATHLILLAQKGAQWDQSEAISVVLTNSKPSIAARLPINGSINASRLVGTALYVASEGWQTGSTSFGSTYGVQLSSFDFSNPAAPIARSTIWCAGGYGNVITATDNYLFAAINIDWSHSDVSVVDISAPDGTMVLGGTIRTAGSIYDKSQMGLNGTVFTAISEVWNWPVSTELETFSISNPAAPVKRGQINLGSNGWLQGSCISGSLVYVSNTSWDYSVTSSPFSIIDLSNPATPTVAGTLNTPGYSTYLQPLGSQLLALGVVNSQVAVSLFDVSNPAAPALLSQVTIGGTNSWSWSDATFDEQAFTVLTDAGLILLPVDSYNSSTGSASQVQLIDIGANSLTERGVIDANFEVSRTAVFNQRILAISGHELLTVNDTNQDSPSVTSDVELAWPVNRVFVQGNYLVELDMAGDWWLPSGPVVRITSSSDPDTILTENDLGGASICGASVHDGKLFLAQTSGGGYVFTSGSFTQTQTTLNLSIYDLSKLPQLALSGTATAQTGPLGWNPSLSALWPNDTTLVWSAAQNWPILVTGPIMVPMTGGVISLSASPSANASPAAAGISVNNSISAATLTVSSLGSVGSGSASTPVLVTAGGASSNLVIWDPWWGGNSAPLLLAFDVTAPSTPAFLGETPFAGGAWNSGATFASNNLIYASHEGAWQITQPIYWADKFDNWRSSAWVHGWTLDVIDFTNPATPVVRDPVSIPNQLVGISNATVDGAILYTEGTQWESGYRYSQYVNFLNASAYDGVSASLIASLKLPDSWDPTAISGSTVLIGSSAGAGTSTGAIAAWTLGATGNFLKLGSTAVAQAPSQMCTLGTLLVATIGYDNTSLFDASNPAALNLLNSGSEPFGLGLNGCDGDPARGVWIPLGDYGVEFLGIAP